MTLQEAINGFLHHCKYEKQLSSKTIEAYTIDLEQFHAFALKNGVISDIQEIKKDILKLYLQELSSLKTKTIKRKVAVLKAMFNYVEYENDGYVNPLHRMKIRLKNPLVLPTVLTTNEVQQILNVLYKELNENMNPKSYRYKSLVRDIAIIELLFATGMRVSELCQLKAKDINLEYGIIKILGKGNKERIIQICEFETIDAMQKYKSLYSTQFSEETSFFINRLGKGLSTQSVRLMVHNHTKKTNIEKSVTPHTFRHTFATLLLEEDVDIRYIQSFLGHSSIAITQIYTHVNAEKQKKILSAKHPRRKMKFLSTEKDMLNNVHNYL